MRVSAAVDHQGRGPTATTPRRARALTAWLPAQEARRLRGSDRPTQVEQMVRERLAERACEPDQTGLLEPWPSSLEPHAHALRGASAAEAMFAEGWELGVISDIGRVIAAQPTVFVDPEPDPGAYAAAGDLAALAGISLPLTAPVGEIGATFDEAQQTWIIKSDSSNLRITGRFGGEVEQDVLGFGFLASIVPSFVSVVECGGRHILRDGYHRGCRLLAAGVVRVPAFVRHLETLDEFSFRHGMLPAEVYGGDRPPTLADYQDDLLAEDVWLPKNRRTIVIRGSELLLESEP